ncbi:hypothetical protein E4633_15135 [Geomonas terrae]|uniref:Uncharacterized protein n=1 Tax=Geomonas terrae TaxID=2562681 RepID=A0A4S1CDX0_9BACT|nr:hypothetical protein [Geomonas terrae]TGU71639.1 hypothetical protein E4633_15135 [Geomonas terrae]
MNDTLLALLVITITALPAIAAPVQIIGNDLYLDKNVFLRGANDGHNPVQPILWGVQPYDKALNTLIQVGPEQDIVWGPQEAQYTNMFKTPLNLFQPHVHIDWRDTTSVTASLAANTQQYIKEVTVGGGTNPASFSTGGGRNQLTLAQTSFNSSHTITTPNIFMQGGSYCKLYFYFQETSTRSTPSFGGKTVYFGLTNNPADPFTPAVGTKSIGLYRADNGSAGNWTVRKINGLKVIDVLVNNNGQLTQAIGQRRIHAMDFRPGDLRVYISDVKGLYSHSKSPDATVPLDGFASSANNLHPFFYTQKTDSAAVYDYTVISDIYFIGET